MGQYANIAPRRMRQFLQWLGHHKAVDVTIGGHHPIKVTCQKSGESYPIPVGRSSINKHIVKHFMEWLVQNGVCTKEEFDQRV